MEAHTVQPFSLPAMHHWVPVKIRPWIVIVLVICFQLSGGVYLAAVSQMVGSLALLQEDILMAGYASMVGMSLTFGVMFRLKFRFTSKQALTSCSIVLILCNIICMNTRSVPLLIGTCFVAGVFRMWATFECNSSIQLWLTPVRDMSVFFSFIYLLVFGMIQVSGLTTIYITELMKWEYMHWFVIGVLYLVLCSVMLLYNNKRFMKILPLYGIDWLGAILWACTTLSLLFICIYGQHYDWFEASAIRMAALIAVVSLILNLWRASFIRHPFVSLQLWKHKVLWITMILYLFFDLLLAPSHAIEQIAMQKIMGYDALHSISLNWAQLAGTIVGAWFTYHYFAVKKWSYRTITCIGFLLALFYLLFSYLTIDYNLPKYFFAIPMFIRNAATCIIGICFLTALTRIPFNIFFQSITINGLVNTCLCGLLGAAVVDHLFLRIVNRNAMLLSNNIDHVATLQKYSSPFSLLETLEQQALLMSIKEIYGWLALLGVALLLLLYVQKGELRPYQVTHPTFKALRRMLHKRQK